MGASTGFSRGPAEDLKGSKGARTKLISSPSKSPIFRVYNATINSTREFKKIPKCRCGTEYACLLHWEAQKAYTPHVRNAEINAEGEASQKAFPTTRRVIRRDIDTTQSLEDLEEWASKEGITLGPAIPDAQARLETLQLIWTYGDVGAKESKEIPATDLIVHRVTPRKDVKPHKAKQYRFNNEKEWWLRQIVQKGIDAGMYEKITTANGRTSQWAAAPVLVNKSDSIEPRLTFNYHFVYEEPSGSTMKLAARAHSLMSNLSHRALFSADMKHGYWGVLVHPDDRNYLAFHVSGLGQLQPTRMPQGARISSFIFIELMNIVLGSIPELNSESSLLHSHDRHTTPGVAFYIDDTFGAHASYVEQYRFLRDHFLPRIIWARMRISLKKLKIGMHEIKVLGQVHRVGGAMNIKKESIEKIRKWPTPQSISEVRGFMGTIQPTRKWVKGFGEIARPLQRLTRKAEWRWAESEDLFFLVLKKQCFSILDMFGHDPALPLLAYTDASAYAGGL